MDPNRNNPSSRPFGAGSESKNSSDPHHQSGTERAIQRAALDRIDVDETKDRLSDSALLRPFAGGGPVFKPLAAPEEIKAVVLAKLKELPPVLANLLALDNTDNMGWKKAAECIEPDPRLTRILIGYMNEVELHDRAEVDSVTRALALVSVPRGIDITLALAFLLFAQRFRPERCEKLDAGHYLRHVLLCAATAKLLAEEFPNAHCDPNRVYAVTLMQKIGVLVLWQSLPELYESVLTRRASIREKLHVVERLAMRTDHGEIGALAMNEWGLLGEFENACRYHLAEDCEETLSNTVQLARLACLLCSAFGRDVTKKQEPPALDMNLKDFLRQVQPKLARGDCMAQLRIKYGERIALREIDVKALFNYIDQVDDMRFVDDEEDEAIDTSEEEMEEFDPLEDVDPLLNAEELEALGRNVAPTSPVPAPEPDILPGEELDADEVETLVYHARSSHSPRHITDPMDFVIPGLAQMRRGLPLLGRIQMAGFCCSLVGILLASMIAKNGVLVFMLLTLTTAVWSLLTIPD